MIVTKTELSLRWHYPDQVKAGRKGPLSIMLPVIQLYHTIDK